MPRPSKFPGYDVLDDDEGFMAGDLYTSQRYDRIPLGGTEDEFSVIGIAIGPTHHGQTFAQRHAVSGYTIIRKNDSWRAIPRRLALSKVGCIELPLP